MTTTVVTEGLTKVYGDVTVVDSLDLELRAGEVFGLLGPNGAGKTTTILMLLGLSEPTSGEARVLGLDPRRNPLEVKRHVGYLPDSVGFYEGLTGRENLTFTGRLNRLDPKTLQGLTDSVLEEVGLIEPADRLTGTYSRGMLQRLGIADALLKDPKILILDEPTTAIDPEGVREILALIRHLSEERGVTVMLASHLLHQVHQVCDRVAIFDRGKVRASGAPHELTRDSEGPERVELTVDRNDLAADLVDRTSFIQHMAPGRMPGTFSFTIDRGATPQLVGLLVRSGVGITGVRRATDDLDHVYRAYFEKAETTND